VPGMMFFAAQYDSVKNAVWLLSISLSTHSSSSSLTHSHERCR
jgi:hypothetical protein